MKQQKKHQQGRRARRTFAPDDFRLGMPRFSEEAFGKNLELVSEVEKLAAAKGYTAAQLTLAWVLTRGEHVVAIPGTRDTKRLDQNAAAVEVELTAEDLAALDAILPAGAAEGTRYTAQGMDSVHR